MLVTRRHFGAIALSTCLTSACSAPKPTEHEKLTVAAASNLMGVFDQIAASFHQETGIEVLLSYGSTAQLARQIENGAPFDVFAAADKEHIAQLADSGKVVASSTIIYARGKLALWIPDGDKTGVRTLHDLTRPEVRFIAIAQPELAPYGKAAVEALKASGLWEALQPKIIYGSNIGMARQYAATGNADATLTALSLVVEDAGIVLALDPKLYDPIDQAAGVVASSTNREAARDYVKFLARPAARTIFREGGYGLPQP